MTLQFGVPASLSPLAHYLPLAKAADEHGYGFVATSDHVVNHETLSVDYPYTDDGARRWEPFTEWADPWVAIGAMAAVTERVRFVTNVFVLPMRNPFAVAKAVGTAAVLSGNRVVLGVGMGWNADEFALLEQPFRARGRRADEMLEVLAELWAGGWVEHHGEFYDFDRLEMSPAPTVCSSSALPSWSTMRTVPVVGISKVLSWLPYSSAAWAMRPTLGTEPMVAGSKAPLARQSSRTTW